MMGKRFYFADPAIETTHQMTGLVHGPRGVKEQRFEVVRCERRLSALLYQNHDLILHALFQIPGVRFKKVEEDFGGKSFEHQIIVDMLDRGDLDRDAFTRRVDEAIHDLGQAELAIEQKRREREQRRAERAARRRVAGYGGGNARQRRKRLRAMKREARTR